MAKEDLSFKDYLKAAFNLKVRIPGLGFLSFNKLILVGFGILGIGHPGFWFLGLAYESAYLLSLSGNERFQKLARAMQEEQVKQGWSMNEQAILSSLDKTSQERYNNLRNICWEIEHSGEKASVLERIEELKIEGLNQLLRIFLRLLVSRRDTFEIIRKTSQIDLEKDIENLKKKMERIDQNSTIFRSLKGTVEIQEKRLDNLIKARENLKVTEAELDRIEKQVSLISEETALSKNPDLLSVRLDSVVQSLQGTTKWMSEHAEFFSSLDEDTTTPSNLYPKPSQKMQKE